MVEIAVENNVVTRQFPDQASRDVNLGTSTAMFTFDNFLRQILIRPDMTLVTMKLNQLYSSTDLFKQACLWKWAVAGQPGLTLDNFAPSKIMKRTDLQDAVANFDLFQATTFGECWYGCTSGFLKRLSLVSSLAYLDTNYIKYVFENVCCWMYIKLRGEGDKDDRKWGDRWATMFSEKLASMVIDHNGQLEWQFVRDVQATIPQEQPTVSRTQLTKTTTTPVIESNQQHQVCFGYLRKELSLPGTDGRTHAGCIKDGCPRAHEGVFKFAKERVLGQLSSAPGNQTDLVSAVSRSYRFA
jgi:hypothetical protein